MRPEPSQRAVSFRYVMVFVFAVTVVFGGLGFLVYLFSGKVDLTNPAVTGLAAPAIASVVAAVVLAIKSFFNSESSNSEGDGDGVDQGKG